MQRIFLFFTFLLLIAQVPAQSLSPVILAPAGMAVTNGNHYLQWTLGEMAMIETFSAGGYHLTQGFHQPEADLPAAIYDDEDFLEEMVLFPNPTSERVNIRYQLKLPGTLSFRLYSLNGVSLMLDQDHVYSGGTETREFSLERISAGLYFVEVSYRSANGMVEKTIFRKLSVVNQ